MGQLFQNVTIVGASGNIGSQLVRHLLKQDKHNINVISRTSSNATFPGSVVVRRGEYSDSEFLEDALRGQDVLVLMLGFAGLKYQDRILEAAARAGVKWVLPSDFGASGENRKLTELVPLFQTKWNLYNKIQALGMKWTSVVTNIWIDYSIEWGTLSFEIPERKAVLYDDSAPFSTSTMSRVGEGVAAFLALSEDVLERNFKNNFLYLSSFTLTQPEVFEAVMKATGTTKSDWSTEHKKAQDLVDEGLAMVKAGEGVGHFKVVYGAHYQYGMNGDYSGKCHNDLLGLNQEDLDETVQAAVAVARPGEWYSAVELQLEKH